MTEKVPNFIIAGASKTGTEWLRLVLQEHPDVWIHMGKAINYFSRHHDRGHDWYEAHFRDRGPERAVGEKDTSLIICDEAPARIAAWNPDVRLIFVLREPIGRAYSHYCMKLRAGEVGEDVDAELSPDSPLVEEGLYFKRIGLFRRHFDDESLAVLTHDELTEDPARYLHQIFRTLGVDETFRPSMLTKKFHVRKTRPRWPRLYRGARDALYWVARHGRTGRRLAYLLRTRGFADAFHRLNRGRDFPALSPAAQQRLAEHYRPDVEALGVWLERDLSHWLAPYAEPAPKPPAVARS